MIDHGVSSARDWLPGPDEPLGILARGIRDAWIDGQRMRFSDGYAAAMAQEAVRLLEDAGYRVVKGTQAPRLTEPAKGPTTSA